MRLGKNNEVNRLGAKLETKIEFVGRVVREVWNSDSFKVYALDVDSNTYPDLKKSKWNNVVINGDIPCLEQGIEYNIIGIEQETKNGWSYKVVNIKRNEPVSANDMFIFLSEILTISQAETLWNVYPDIVQRVKENRLDDIDFDKLKGIKEKTFEKIKQKIIDNFCLSDLVVSFRGYLSLPIIKRIYNKYTSIEVLKQKLKENPYKCLCGLAHTGFKTADKTLLEIEKVSKDNIKNNKPPIIEFDYELKSSMQRCLSSIIYLLEENENNGHTKMNLAELRKECMKLVPACADKFTEAIKDKSIWYDKSTMDCALSKTYDTEEYIAKRIVSGLNDFQAMWTFNIEKYRTVNGCQLLNEQMNVLSNLCNNQICVLNGSGGTGKSFSTQAIINMLEDNHKTYRLFSPTGKAAKVLKEYTHRPTATIHRGLCYNPNGFYYQDGKVVNSKDKNITYNYYTPFGMNKYHQFTCDVIIVDEFGMVDIYLFKALLEAIDFNTTKLLMIGDNAQLCSVGCGNLLHDFMQSKLIPTSTLTQVFRYGEGGLMKVATDVRQCKSYLDKSMRQKVTTFGNNKDYTFVYLQSEDIPKNAVALYKKLLEKGNDVENIQVLTSKNVGDCGANTLNNLIQMVANPNYGSDISITCGDVTYYLDDFIMQKVNNYNAKICEEYLSEEEREFMYETGETPTAFVANGETGKIVSLDSKGVVINFDGVYIEYDKSELTMIGLAYCITVHKSQGSSIDNIIVCTPKSHIFMLNSNLLYVALTRMRKKCYHLGSYNTVNQAVTKKANLERQTLTQQLLEKFNKTYNSSQEENPITLDYETYINTLPF